MGWATDYMRTAFVEMGRDHAGCDCWGLIKLAAFEQAGWDWPDFHIGTYDRLDVVDAIKTESNKASWRSVDLADVLPFDVVVMRSRFLLDGLQVSAPAHVGIVTDERKLLHTQEPYGVAHVPLDHVSVRSRIVGAYRWQP